MTGLKQWVRVRYRSALYLAVTDWLILVGGMGLALRLRFRPLTDLVDMRSIEIGPDAGVFLVYAAFSVGLLAWLDLYKRRILISPAWHALQIAKGVYAVTVLYVVLQYLAKATHLFVESRFVVIAWGALAFAGLLAHRLVFYPLLRRLVSHSGLRRRVVIVGATEVGRDFARKWASDRSRSTLEVIGFLDAKMPRGTTVVEDLPCLGEPAELSELVLEHQIEGAVVTCEDITYEQLLDLIEACVSLFGWVDIHCNRSRVLHDQVLADSFFDIPFVRMHESGGNAAFLLYKRLVDVLGSTAGILLLSPLFLLCAALVKLSSPGPVFYVADRIGIDGRPFPFFKFRSLRLGADRDQVRLDRIRELVADDTQVAAKLVNEQYLTPIGRFMRKWALDELPQLFNVLRGDMSLVGPRPLPRGEYELQSEWQKRRFAKVKPGGTGLWKLYATQQGISFNHTVLYDIYYARNMSPLMDLYILLGTLALILKGRADG